MRRHKRPRKTKRPILRSFTGKGKSHCNSVVGIVWWEWTTPNPVGLLTWQAARSRLRDTVRRGTIMRGADLSAGGRGHEPERRDRGPGPRPAAIDKPGYRSGPGAVLPRRLLRG